ncbi:MerR family transcriptional regulator [Candidatus Babeliales bacterium]|nr:MerR family transcriptional regulator [Candidatus Babeliales bacterium]
MKMQKKQFRIGYLADHLGVEKSVIRFWEKEFKVYSSRSGGGQRFYEEKDLNKFKTIKILLYDKGFTIAGAKKQLKQNGVPILGSHKTTLPDTIFEDQIFVAKMKNLRSKLIELRKNI